MFAAAADHLDAAGPRWLGRRLPHLVIEFVAVIPVLPVQVPPVRNPASQVGG